MKEFLIEIQGYGTFLLGIITFLAGAYWLFGSGTGSKTSTLENYHKDNQGDQIDNYD